MAKTVALGTKLLVNTTEDNWVAVGNLTSIGVPGPTKQEIDVTDFDSAGAESLPGLPDFGSLEFSGNFNGTDAGQTALFNDAQDVLAPVRQFRIEFTRQDVRFSFSGYVSSFTPNAGGPTEAYTFDGSIRVSGAVTRVSPIPA